MKADKAVQDMQCRPSMALRPYNELTAESSGQAVW